MKKKILVVIDRFRPYTPELVDSLLKYSFKQRMAEKEMQKSQDQDKKVALQP